jgi:hypothetical protein
MSWQVQQMAENWDSNIHLNPVPEKEISEQIILLRVH